MPFRIRYLPTVALLLLFAGPYSAGKKSGPLPYRLVIEIGQGKLAGSSSVRERVGRELTNAVEQAGCFRSVHLTAPVTPQADDLLLRLTVVDYGEETDYQFSLSQTNDPNLQQERLTTVEARAELAVEVLTLREGLSLRSRRFASHSSWTPRLGEDPREEARERLIADVVRSARAFACKGNSNKWAKQLESVRAGSTPR